MNAETIKRDRKDIYIAALASLPVHVAIWLLFLPL